MTTASSSPLSTNVGRPDQTIRIAAGLILAVAAAFFLQGGWALVAWVLSLILIVTGLVRFCPLYRLLRINTCRVR